ncbi:hypothetical protein DEU56DRAFT_908154 [Suillus clintonianus]|uniref:uncharacterized protein n=1 Tax=Suillus clintonianus TaxID=1904413 RepID=UPI001B866CCD|nr:uncharacterized protein DEU56DRAFT_908154 [Suillus clintonianus]KAG2151295.1 hypothetical protein DEU56DRAFT_908154 [Suillus clintonianus]
MRANDSGYSEFWTLESSFCNRALNTVVESKLLAVYFPIVNGQVLITVPEDTMTRDNAIVVLFGDSGSTSPELIIV